MSDDTNTNSASRPAPAAAAHEAEQNAAPKRSLKARRWRLLGATTGVLVLLGAAYGAYWSKDLRYVESTDDAYVSGNVVQITPQVSGTVVEIGADNTQFVKAGQTLVRLDQE